MYDTRSSGMRPSGIIETAVYAHDLEAAERFYAGVLGLETCGRRDDRHVFFRCGMGMFLVFNPDVTGRPGAVGGGTPVPLHGARGPGHAAFSMRADEVDSWRRRLEDHGVSIEAEVRWPGGGHSLYFRDPAGNSIELVTPEAWGFRHQV